MQTSPKTALLAAAVLAVSVGCSAESNSDPEEIDASETRDTATSGRDGLADGEDAPDSAGDTTAPDDGRDTASDTAATDTSARDTSDPVEWQQAPAVGSGPRQEHQVAVLDSKLYLIGGFDDGPQMLESVEVFDPADGSWSTAAPVPEPLHHANVAVLDEEIYVLGYLVENFRAKGEVYAYDPAADEWRAETPMPSGRERGSSAVAAIGDKIYVAGGLRGGTAVATFSAYDPQSDSWTELPDAPRSADHAAAGAIDGRLVLAGGRDASIGAHTDRVDIFDPNTGSWSSGAPMPSSRAGVASTVWAGHLIVLGGEGNPDDADGVFPQAEAYDLAADEWTPLPDMLNPRHGMEAGVVDGTLYVPGGGDVQGFGAVDTHTTLEISKLLE